MNCSEVRAALPERLYGGLAPEVQTNVDAHLSRCLECQVEADGLRQVRRLLTAAPVPEVKVDAAALYRLAAERQALRVRRWRRLALAACAAAVIAAVLTGLARLEIHVGGSELVARWGQAPQVQPPSSPPVAPAPLAPDASGDLAAIDERLRMLGELTQALAEDGRDRDGQRRQEIARLQEQIRQWQGLSSQRLNAMEKDFDALYVAQFPSRKGGTP